MQGHFQQQQYEGQDVYGSEYAEEDEQLDEDG